jgi:hypothetical protein
VELLLARNALGQVELAADLGRRIEQGDLVPALGGVVAQGKPAGPAPTTADALRLCRRAVDEFGLVAGARVDQTAGLLVDEHVIQAGLIAGDAGVDLGAADLARPS